MKSPNKAHPLAKAAPLFAVIITILFTGNAIAVSLGPDCEPRGLIAKGKEAWDPKSFWKGQIGEIKEYVDAQRTAYKLSMIERKRDRINERLDDEEMKAMGIEQYSNPGLDREMAKIDRELMQMDRQMLNDAIEWGRKCTAYANMKLSRVNQ